MTELNKILSWETSALGTFKLLDNAIKYGCDEHPVEISISKNKETFLIGIKNYGDIIDKKD